MFGSNVLDVAIGLCLVYLLLSTLCLALNELVAMVARSRAAYLEAGIRNLLRDDGLAKQIYGHPLIQGLYRDGRLPSYIPARAFATSLMNVLFPQQSADAGLASLRARVAEMSDPAFDDHLKGALLAMIDRSEGKTERLRGEIEAWYNQAMDRVSGWYKRRTQWATLLASAALVVATNADTLQIVRQISTDPVKRAALVAVAEDRVKSLPPPAVSASTAGTYQADVKLIAETYHQLDGLGLALGWSRVGVNGLPHDSLGWLNKVLGWALSIFAVSLGAPFWFDILNRLVVVRSTVKPHEKSPEGASKDLQQPRPG
jgi:hypothetical protein